MCANTVLPTLPDYAESSLTITNLSEEHIRESPLLWKHFPPYVEQSFPDYKMKMLAVPQIAAICESQVIFYLFIFLKTLFPLPCKLLKVLFMLKRKCQTKTQKYIILRNLTGVSLQVFIMDKIQNEKASFHEFEVSGVTYEPKGEV